MRISTNTIYDRGVDSINRQQADMLKTQQQVASGRRVLTPADDPVAAARALDIGQADSANSQYVENQNRARDSLGLAESVLGRVTELLHDVRTLTVQAGNPALSNSDRASIAGEVNARLDELLGLSNTRDGTGQYLFSGFQGHTKPFSQTPAGFVYAGDQGQRLVQVSPSRTMEASESGTEVFERARNGNGIFVTAPAAANAGSGVLGAGTVTDPALLTGHDYRIDFTVAAGVTTFAVVDVTAGTTLSAGNPYVSGRAVAFDGIQLSVEGVPADGDRYTVAPSTRQSLFQTLQNLVDLLQTPAQPPAGGARLANGIAAGLLDLDQGLDHILTVRAAGGSRLKELDSLQSMSEDLSLQYQQTLSQLQDLDFAKAISRISQQQAYLEAAQKSFLKVSGLSLFRFV